MTVKEFLSFRKKAKQNYSCSSYLSSISYVATVWAYNS